MKRVNKNKIYNFIGRAVVYSSLYIAGIVFSYWAFLQRDDLLGGESIWKNLSNKMVDLLLAFYLFLFLILLR